MLDLPAVDPGDGQIRFVLHDWLKAGDAVQRTVAHLSQQLRRFLDDQAYAQNRRVAQLVRGIEAMALRVRDEQPAGVFTDLPGTRADIAMPMSRRLHDPTVKVRLDEVSIEAGEQEFDAAALYSAFTVDETRLRAAIDTELQDKEQVSLAEVVEDHAITQGLAELMTYLSIADHDPRATFSEASQRIEWESDGASVEADTPTVIFTRSPDE